MFRRSNYIREQFMIKMTGKATITLSALLLLGGLQQLKAQTMAQNDQSTEQKSIIKMNVAAIAFKSYSFQYEYAAGKKIAVALGYRFMPKSGVPFKSTINSMVDDEQTKTTIDNFKTSNFAITPEVRFYLGKDVFRGFYVAPFLRYARYKAEGPFDFQIEELNTTETMFFKGSVNTYTGGVLVGAQWKLSKLVYLDWWILGPSYGGSKGNLKGERNLNPLEQQELREQIGNFVDDLPIVKATATVDGNGANIDFKGPWAGLRAGLNVGFRF